MPIFALFNFDDLNSVAADSALENGAENGVYLDGATPDGGRVVLDGVDDKVKIYSNPNFQLDRGTINLRFSQTEHNGDGPNTVLSRDSVGETNGGYHVDVLADGSIVVIHESDSGTTSFQTEPGFLNPGDDINFTYSWDVAAGGALQIENLTAGTEYSAPVPAGLTMVQPTIQQPWLIGGGLGESDPGVLNDVGPYFEGSVGVFSISDTVDIAIDQDPVANPDAAETDEDTPVTIAVLGNDTDPNGDALSVVGTPVAANGTVTVNDDGALVYTPNPDFNGEDSITYTITDPDGNEASSTVTVTVNPVNDAPVAVADAGVTDINTAVTLDIIANDTDIDNANPELLITGTPTSEQGTVTVGADGRSITFTPNAGFTGVATVAYSVTDPGGLIDDNGVVTITVADTAGDGFVDGTGGADLIDTAYTGDPDGDLIDAGDAILPGDAPNDDRVRAGDGDDTVRAGLGDDSVLAGAGDDSVSGGVGDDSLLGEAGNDTLLGEAGNDSLTGGSGDDFLDGGLGDDTISGGDGNDLVFGRDGDDLIDTSRGGIPLPDRDYPGLYPADADPNDDLDTVFGGAGNDTITTGDDADLIFGGAGDDFADGGIDDDSILGGSGNDTLIGGEGADTLLGEDGDDLIYGGLGPDVPDAINIPDVDGDLRPDNGTDVIFGGAGNDTVFGQDDDDTIFGGTGADLLDGGVDDDVIFGDEGNDTITGGEGADTLFGGADRDTFLVNVQGDGAGDRIDGNETGDDFDTLDLRGAGPLNIVYTANPENGTVSFLDDDGNVTGTLDFVNIENVIPCFTPGTMIATPKGEIPVEKLRAGDRVITRDNGIQEIRWTGSKALDWAALTANMHLRPIMIRQGALGNGLPERDMMVSPNHRVLVANDRTALYFDEHEVLVAAKHLIGAKGIFEVESSGTTYLHLMFDQHEVVLSDGAWTESFQPGDYTLKGMGNAQRNEILEIFPELKTREGLEDYMAARRTLKKHEAKLLVR